MTNTEKKPIRILHSVSNMQRAGIETMLMNYYRHMDTSKIQFDFLCNKKEYGEYEPEIQLMGGHIYRSPGLNPIHFLKYKKYIKEILKNDKSIKVLHAHNESMAAYSLLSAKWAGLKYRIFHSHNTQTVHDYKYPLKMLCKKILKFGYNEKFACGKLAGEYYFGKNDFHILHNAIDIEKFKFSQKIRNEIRKKYNIENKYVIGHIGRFCKQKNQSFLIDIFNEYHKKNKNAYLVLIGNGEMLNEIKEKVKNLCLDNDVLFLDSIPNTNEWYSAFDVFVLPSIYEGLPVVAIEAEASGVPCIFSDKISNEVMITENCMMIPLNKKLWINNIDYIPKFKRDICGAEKITNAGYDINIESKKLFDYYMALTDTKG